MARRSGLKYCVGAGSASLGQYSVQFRQHFKGIGYVKHVRFSSCPSAVRVEIHRTALVDEPPAHDMGLLAMATRGQTLGMARRRSGLADLVQMGHETEHRLTLSRLIDQRFAAAQGCARGTKEIKNQRLRLIGVG